MYAEILDRRNAVASLACHYADGVVLALAEIENEQQLREGLVGAFLAFMEDALSIGEELCPHRTGTHDG